MNTIDLQNWFLCRWESSPYWLIAHRPRLRPMHRTWFSQLLQIKDKNCDGLKVGMKNGDVVYGILKIHSAWFPTCSPPFPITSNLFRYSQTFLLYFLHEYRWKWLEFTTSFFLQKHISMTIRISKDLFDRCRRTIVSDFDFMLTMDELGKTWGAGAGEELCNSQAASLHTFHTDRLRNRAPCNNQLAATLSPIVE